MYYDVPEGLGLRKIAEAEPRSLYNHPGVMQEQNRIYNPLAAPFFAARNFVRGVADGRRGRTPSVPTIPQRPNIPAPADDPAPTNQRPAGYGTTPKPVPSEWAQKIKDYQNGLAGPANAPIEYRRHLYRQIQSSPFIQRYIDRVRSGSK